MSTVRNVLALFVTMISVILTFDTYNFFILTKTIDGAGFGLTVLLGLVEVNDRILNSEVNIYLFGLCITTIILWGISLLMINKWIRKPKVKV